MTFFNLSSSPFCIVLPCLCAHLVLPLVDVKARHSRVPRSLMGEDELEREPALLQTMSSYIHKETGKAETFASKIDFCL